LAGEKVSLKFKIEAALLVVAIALFAVAVMFYSYQSSVAEDWVLSQSAAFPYRGVAFLFLGVGSVSMVTASISYSKKTRDSIA
jgi:cell division protein FtsX